MKIDLQQVLQDVDGTTLIDASQNAMNLYHVFKTALLSPIDEDKNASPDEKLKMWDLSKRAYKSYTDKINMELTVEDAAFIKARVNKVFLSAVVVGNVNEMLEK